MSAVNDSTAVVCMTMTRITWQLGTVISIEYIAEQLPPTEIQLFTSSAPLRNPVSHHVEHEFSKGRGAHFGYVERD